MGVVNKMAFNVAITFVRMAATIGIGIYSVRLLVNALGETDYGIYGLLGGGAAMVAVIQASLVLTAVRHLSHSLGQEDPQELQAVFTTLLVLFLLAALVILCAGFAVTPLVLAGFNYPAERESAVMVTWMIMIATTSILVARAPYGALFIAHQAMGQEAIFTTMASLFMLFTAVLVSQFDGDRLTYLAWLLLGIRAVETAIYIIVGMLRFPEGRPQFSLMRRDLFTELLSFSGWSLLDAITLRMRTLGSNLVLNPFFGPPANAAYTIGSQLQHYEISVAKMIQRATDPVIITSYARGNFEFVRKMVLTVSRLSTIVLSAICIPLMLEISFLLRVWVQQVPAYSEQFCLAMLLTLLVEQSGVGFVAANQAEGEIKLFNIVTVLGLAIPLGLISIVFALGFGSPPMLSVAVLLGMVGVVIFRASYAGARIELPFQKWASNVVGRCLVVIGTSSVVAYSIQASFPDEGWRRTAIVCMCFWSSLGIMTWGFGLVGYEKATLLTWISNLARSLRLTKQS